MPSVLVRDPGQWEKGNANTRPTLFFFILSARSTTTHDYLCAIKTDYTISAEFLLMSEGWFWIIWLYRWIFGQIEEKEKKKSLQFQ